MLWKRLTQRTREVITLLAQDEAKPMPCRAVAGACRPGVVPWSSRESLLTEA